MRYGGLLCFVITFTIFMAGTSAEGRPQYKKTIDKMEAEIRKLQAEVASLEALGPATRHWTTWLGYPLVRWQQRRFAHESQWAMIDATARVR